MTTHEQYMQKALQEAAIAAEEGEIPVGAIIVCQGKIIARAHNETQKLHDVTAHAEMIAITMATSFLGGKYLNECTLYVTMEPCTMCAGALAWAQIGGLVYGAPDPQRGYSRLSPAVLHPRTQITSDILSNECSEIIKHFFRKKRGGTVLANPTHTPPPSPE
ncbi:MAG: nucleoside deaminase [Odoribacter sp.]